MPIAICFRHLFWLLSLSSLSFCNRNYECVYVYVEENRLFIFGLWQQIYIFLFTTFSNNIFIFVIQRRKKKRHTPVICYRFFCVLLYWRKKRTNKYVKYIPKNGYLRIFFLLRIDCVFVENSSSSSSKIGVFRLSYCSSPNYYFVV